MQPIIFTDKAAERVKKITKEKNNTDLKLRVYVTGGGCSGFQYGFKLEQETQENDLTIKNQDVELIIDYLSLQYLANSKIDFSSGLEGSRFFVDNPNASTTCSCGSSFNI